jgi:hypothetical protein
MLRLHPDFCLEHRAFARQHGVDLADDVFPETDFREDPDNPDSDERLEKNQSNIHLVRHRAIRLLAVRDDCGDWVRSIDLNPSLLLYEAKRHLLSEGDLLLSLDILRSQVAPLLADPLDARHIVPGLFPDDEPVAYWSLVDSEFLLPGIQIPCLHRLSHPSTGPAEGAKNDRIQLGDKQDHFLIRFKKARWDYADLAGTQNVEGVRVRLILKGPEVAARFKQFGTTALIGDEKELVAFSERSVASVHQAMMSQLEGTYLPVPPEWKVSDQGKPVTHAKAIALLAKLTPIPLEELRAMDEEIRHPSKSTRKRLNKDVPEEVSRLMPVPVSTLFESAAYATQEPGWTPQPRGRIDPLIAETYGQR